MSSLTPIRSNLDLERRLARLESVISVDAIGNVLIHATGSIRITGARNVDITADAVISVNGGCSLSIQAPSVSIKADADASMQGAMLKLSAQGPAELQGGTLHLNANPVRINFGSKPIARSGDMVVTPGGMGTIGGPGNPTILV
jgi:hypothetical protein